MVRKCNTGVVISAERTFIYLDEMDKAIGGNYRQRTRSHGISA